MSSSNAWHPMGEHVAQPAYQRRIVQHGLRRATPFPETATPIHQPPHLPGEIGVQVLHEVSECRSPPPHQQVEVIGSKSEGVHPNGADALLDGSRQHASHHFVDFLDGT
jgi:hypothetical protein